MTIQTLAPLYCSNESCRELERTGRRQVVAEGEPGRIVRAWCASCRKYTTGRV